MQNSKRLQQCIDQIELQNGSPADMHSVVLASLGMLRASVKIVEAAEIAAKELGTDNSMISYRAYSILMHAFADFEAEVGNAN